jgi:hypothetical protein
VFEKPPVVQGGVVVSDHDRAIESAAADLLDDGVHLTVDVGGGREADEIGGLGEDRLGRRLQTIVANTAPSTTRTW